MDKLIDLESVKQLVIDTVKENALTDEEIAECGAACGCGTTTADLGAAVQYLGDKKKKEGILGAIGGGIIGNQIGSGFPIAGACLGSIAQDALTNDDNDEEKESNEELDEMSRGILAPQEVAKREYATQYPDMGVNTADQFLRKVILNPEAPGHKEYIDRLAYLIRNVSSDSQFSNIAADVQLNNEDDSDNTELSTSYANAVLGHRKSMSKSSYDSKGLINAYQRNVIKRGPYYKAGRDLVKQAIQSVGKNISDKYNEVDPAQSNKVLVNFFKGEDWKSLDDNQKIKEINVIKDEADLDEIGSNIVSKEEHNILDRLIGDDE